MDEQISVIIHALHTPLLLFRCIGSIKRQNNMCTQIQVLIEEKDADRQKKQIEDSGASVLVHQSGGIREIVKKAVGKSRAPFVLFMNSDEVLEQGALSRMIEAIGNADGLIFNISVTNKGYFCRKVYETNIICENILKNDSEDENTLSLRQVYENYPNRWNHLFRKDILLNGNIYFNGIDPSNQYYTIARYHTLCRSVACCTDIFVYRQLLAPRETPKAEFSIYYRKEIRAMLSRAYKRMHPEAYAMLMRDFIQEPLARSYNGTGGITAFLA